MKMSQAFPSKYLKATDLEKQRHVVTIASVVEEEGIDKPIMYFQGIPKGMALNKTNAMMICSLYGDDTNGWTGQKIELYEASVSFNNQFVPAIRVMAPPNAPPAPLGAPTPASPVPGQTPATNAAPASDFQTPSAFGQPATEVDDGIPWE